MIKGFVASLGDSPLVKDFVHIEKAFCCKPKGNPDTDGQCRDEPVEDNAEMHQCPEGYFIKGYHYGLFGGRDQFRCCRLKAGLC